jgi:hypothetical protein
MRKLFIILIYKAIILDEKIFADLLKSIILDLTMEKGLKKSRIYKYL